MTADERRAEWDPKFRFRPYRLRKGSVPGVDAFGQEWLAGAGCPDEGGIGTMLTTLKGDGEYGDDDRVGILDTADWQRGQPGSWVINPHATGKE